MNHIYRIPIVTLLFFCFLAVPGYDIHAQNLFPEPGQVFRDDIVPRIDVFLSADDLANIFAPGNEDSNEHKQATFVFDNGEIRDTVFNVGFRLRGNTSRYAQKKSFKISFNTFVQGRQWKGLEKLNLNGEHNDPTVSRSKLCWDLLRDIGVPAPRANHVRLYINGAYYGVYANVEHIDEEFVDSRFGNKNGNLYKCLWPADLHYLGDDPDKYKYGSGDRRAYELITNTQEDDYSDLAHFIDILNSTPTEDLKCNLESVFNMETYINAMAFDILSGNWDGPLFNKNNFYLYKNTETGLFEYIPYDLDNTFGIDWFGIDWGLRNVYTWGHQNEYRPLYSRILQVPEYLEMFSFTLHSIIQAYFNEETLFPKIDRTRDLISQYIQNDAYYPLDYGFDHNDFIDGFEDRLPFNHTKEGIKSYMSKRRAAAINQIVFYDIKPFITGLSESHTTASQDVAFSARVTDDTGLSEVRLCYKTGGNDYTCNMMYDDGLHGDEAANDRVFGISLPAFNQITYLNYFIEAVDNAGQIGRLPACGTNFIFIGNTTFTLAVNEFMASNRETIADEAGEYDDWVELYNYGTSAIALGDKYLSDSETNPDKWALPDMSLGSGEYLIVWADGDEEQGPLHTSFKLDAQGEFIGLFDDAGILIDGIAFNAMESDEAIGRLPNGTGQYVIVTPTPGSSNAAIVTSSSETKRIVSIAVYPNPTTDILYIDTDEELHSALNIKILDLSGRCVDQFTFSQPIMIHTNSWPQGVYYLVIDSKREPAVTKILKF